MNALRFRGHNREKRTSLQSIVSNKMKNVLWRWLCGTSAKYFRQLHFHIEDPHYVILHEYAEQTLFADLSLRTSLRLKGGEMCGGLSLQVRRRKNRRGLRASHRTRLVSRRPYCSMAFIFDAQEMQVQISVLHLFCATVASFEFLVERNHPHCCSTNLHGGLFAFPWSSKTTFPARLHTMPLCWS